ncbi:hypothetical protein F4777DRAFT_372273 [Nemania sp. FL0916]|nr:hypothetical protein F4777DRAFT_372273 [Nemania sp. FL0916]
MASQAEASAGTSADVTPVTATATATAAAVHQHQHRQQQHQHQHQNQYDPLPTTTAAESKPSLSPPTTALLLQQQQQQHRHSPSPTDHHHDHLHNHQEQHVSAAPPTTTTITTTTAPEGIATATTTAIAASHPELYDDPTFASSTSTVPAAVVAHHGLQVLQATSSAASMPMPMPMPMSMPTGEDLAQQYAQSAALQMGEPQFSSPLAAAAAGGTTGTALTEPHGSQKVTRLRRACDMCSQRKVKCDESGPPCKPCSDLQVECTFRREMKRRGPPNKHAEAARAAKRHQHQHQPQPGAASSTTPTPTPHDPSGPFGAPPPPLLAPAESSSASGFTLDAEAIAPWPVLELLVDDFFTYIHPLTPFPHEPSFRQAFAARADRSNREFLALLASMMGVLVASFPRSARAHLKAQHSAQLFPTAVTMINHCRFIALEARGSAFMAKQEMSVDDAAASYFLGLSAGYTLQWKLCRRFLAETMSFCRELGIHRPRDLPSLAGYLPDPAAAVNAAAQRPIDHIKDQIGKRIFWVMVAGIRSMSQLGASINELPLPPPTTQEPYPEQPVEVDDEYISPDQILPQPEGTISLITGFNRNIRIYMTMNELIGVEMCYGISFFDWSAQKNIITNGLESAKQAIEHLPPQLQTMKVELDQDDAADLDRAGLEYCPPAFPEAQPDNDVRRALAEPLRRRQLQSEIQKANIHASQLATRSYFVERYLNLRDAHGENNAQGQGQQGGAAANNYVERDEMVARERESIVRDLLTVLTSINQRSLEPNGQSLINKIRQVASTLVSGARSRKGPVAVKAEDYLSRFIEILMRLERAGMTAVVGNDIDSSIGGAGNGTAVDSGSSGGSMTMGPRDEEDELGNWASLREYQVQFIEAGGFLTGDM